MRHHAVASYAFDQLTGRKPGNIFCSRATTGSRRATSGHARPSTSRLRMRAACRLTESTFTLESRPIRWKKYSFPSSAAMKPNPRSWTSFLIVPVGIEHSSSRKLVANARVLSRRSDRGEHHPATGGRDYLTTRFEGRPKKPSRIFATGLRGQKRDARQCCNCPCELQRSPALLAETPQSPHRYGHHRRLADGSHHRQR